MENINILAQQQQQNWNLMEFGGILMVEFL